MGGEVDADVDGTGAGGGADGRNGGGAATSGAQERCGVVLPSDVAWETTTGAGGGQADPTNCGPSTPQTGGVAPLSAAAGGITHEAGDSCAVRDTRGGGAVTTVIAGGFTGLGAPPSASATGNNSFPRAGLEGIPSTCDNRLTLTCSAGNEAQAECPPTAPAATTIPPCPCTVCRSIPTIARSSAFSRRSSALADTTPSTRAPTAVTAASSAATSPTTSATTVRATARERAAEARLRSLRLCSISCRSSVLMRRLAAAVVPAKSWLAIAGAQRAASAAASDLRGRLRVILRLGMGAAHLTPPAASPLTAVVAVEEDMAPPRTAGSGAPRGGEPWPVTAGTRKTSDITDAGVTGEAAATAGRGARSGVGQTLPDGGWPLTSPSPPKPTGMERPPPLAHPPLFVGMSHASATPSGVLHGAAPRASAHPFAAVEFTFLATTARRTVGTLTAAAPECAPPTPEKEVKSQNIVMRLVRCGTAHVHRRCVQENAACREKETSRLAAVLHTRVARHVSEAETPLRRRAPRRDDGGKPPRQRSRASRRVQGALRDQPACVHKGEREDRVGGGGVRKGVR